jgi:hypothetical protein
MLKFSSLQYLKALKYCISTYDSTPETIPVNNFVCIIDLKETIQRSVIS